ncbi:bifunctional phosphoribosylaminoimidazole carboxylase/phosphoribosylaminoimidazole succinocarboxamide synthetase [Ciona intestinalis]
MATTHKINSNGDEPKQKMSRLDVKMESGSGPITQFESGDPNKNRSCDEAFTLGKMFCEGKTKVVYEINTKTPGRCLIVSKDIITAGDGAKRNVMEGKAELSSATNAAVMQMLNDFGLKTAFIKVVNKKSFLAWKCDMIPIEWVARRVATGSFIRRHVGVKEGYRFSPPKLETFYKDDENHDPQWSREVLEEAKLKCGKIVITPDLIDIMEKMTITIFEVLEKAWKSKNVSLIDMKIEFGVRQDTNEIILADVIDNDSWRIWPSGDKRLMKDKQVYRNLKEVTNGDMQNLKENYTWVSNQLTTISEALNEDKNSVRVAVCMGSPKDMAHCNKIKAGCTELGVRCTLHVSSAHKSTTETLKMLAKIEDEASVTPTVLVAVAGRSNGLGPVISGNTVLPVINCPPPSEQWGRSDIWSSLRLPSGLGCATLLDPQAAATCASQILAQHTPLVWSRLRVKQMQYWIDLKQSNDGLN